MLGWLTSQKAPRSPLEGGGGWEVFVRTVERLGSFPGKAGVRAWRATAQSAWPAAENAPAPVPLGPVLGLGLRCAITVTWGDVLGLWVALSWGSARLEAGAAIHRDLGQLD